MEFLPHLKFKVISNFFQNVGNVCSFSLQQFIIKVTCKNESLGGAWVAQLSKHATFHFNSGRDLSLMRSNPVSGFMLGVELLKIISLKRERGRKREKERKGT